MRLSRQILGWTLLLMSAAVSAENPPIQNYFNTSEGGLFFTSGQWSVRSEEPRGLISLKVKEAEFLSCPAQTGALLFQKGDAFISRFPDFSNLSHDSSLGRMGSISNGNYLIRIEPHWTRPEFELYLGFNDNAEHKALLWLGDDVAFVRFGNGEQARMGLQSIVTRSTKTPVSGPLAVIVHKKGYAIVVQSGKDANGPAFSAGMVKDPGGQDRLALVFPCKGFAANTFKVSVEPYALQDNFILHPGFQVKSSDDGKDANQLAAADGVVNPIYSTETKVDFAIQTGWLGDEPFNGYAELDIVHALGQKHFYERVDLKGAAADANGKITAVFHPKFTLPGVSEVWGRLIGVDNRLLWVGRYRMSYDWEHFKPDILVQPDMKEFWDNTLAQLRKQPLEETTERVKKFEDHPKFEIYTVSFNNWGGKRVYAMMFVPKNHAAPLPAIVTAHPGTTGFDVNKRPDGVYGSELKYDPRFVTIVPLIRGFKPDEKDIPFNYPWWGPLNSRDDYVARSWYCAMTRAVDYLATRADIVDPNRIVVMGGSQGGALALVTAALDSRIKYCFADCPSNCQLHESMEHYGTFGPTKEQVPEGQSVDDMKKMLSYYNPVNFCLWIKCPAYVGSNIGDLTVHSMGPLAAFHNLTGLKTEEKAFYPGFSHAHGSGPGLHLKQSAILDQLGGPSK